MCPPPRTQMTDRLGQPLALNAYLLDYYKLRSRRAIVKDNRVSVCLASRSCHSIT